MEFLLINHCFLEPEFFGYQKSIVTACVIAACVITAGVISTRKNIAFSFIPKNFTILALDTTKPPACGCHDLKKATTEFRSYHIM